MAKPFYHLTNRGRARRLRRLALKALMSYELRVARIGLISNDVNGIFRVDSDAGAKYILRVTTPEGGHSKGNLHSEMLWLTALSQDTDLGVPRPVLARTGEMVIEVACAGVPEPRLCVLFAWVPGSDLANHMNETSLMKLGKLSAQLHAHAAEFRPPVEFDILRYDKVFPFPEPVVLFDTAYEPLFPPARRAIYRQAVRVVQAAVDLLQASGEPMRVIHGDLHQWNVRWYRGLLSPIDFEDLMWGWPVQDIATTLYYLLPYQEYQRWRSAFQRGYVNHAPWPERYTGEIDAFIAARGLCLVNSVLQDPDPNWQTEIPAFIERIEDRLRMLLD